MHTAVWCTVWDLLLLAIIVNDTENDDFRYVFGFDAAPQPVRKSDTGRAKGKNRDGVVL